MTAALRPGDPMMANKLQARSGAVPSGRRIATRLALTLTLLLASAPAARPARAAPATLQTSADVRIIKPLKVTPTQDLDFGSLVVANLNVLGGARLTLSPSGNASATGGLLTVWVAAGRHPGEAKVAGEPQLAYVVSAPASIDLKWGKNLLSVEDFRFSSSTKGGSGGSGYLAQLNGSGNDVLAIGGTLVFPPSLVGLLLTLLSKSLSVTVPVTVQYQ